MDFDRLEQPSMPSSSVIWLSVGAEAAHWRLRILILLTDRGDCLG